MTDYKVNGTGSKYFAFKKGEVQATKRILVESLSDSTSFLKIAAQKN